MSWQARQYVTTNSRHRGGALLLLLAIADHAHPDGTGAHMSVETLAKDTRLTRRHVQRMLRVLERSGELQAAARHRTGTTVYSIVGAGIQQLPLLVDNVVPIVRPGGATFLAGGGDVGVMGGATSTPRGGDVGVTQTGYEPTGNGYGTGARAAAREAIPTKMATPEEVAREQKAWAKEVAGVWASVADQRGSPYTDSAALKMVREQVVAALRWATEAQVVAAIRARLERDSSPRRIPEWARERAADEREEAERQRKMRERQDQAVPTAVDALLRATSARIAMPGGRAGCSTPQCTGTAVAGGLCVGCGARRRREASA